MGVPVSSLIVFPQPISIVALTMPLPAMGERLARLMDVVPLEPTEKALNFDSRTLMMSSNRSVARDASVGEGLVAVSSPQAAQSGMRRHRAANCMVNS